MNSRDERLYTWYLVLSVESGSFKYDILLAHSAYLTLLLLQHTIYFLHQLGVANTEYLLLHT